VNLETPTVAPQLDLAPLARFLQPTRLIPPKAIVRMTGAARSPKAPARTSRRRGSIYEWHHRQHLPRFRRSAAAASATSGSCWSRANLGGKMRLLDALFSACARAAGHSRRATVYGLRVAGSEKRIPLGLGLSSDRRDEDAHCRAEVYLTGYGGGAGRFSRGRSESRASKSRRAIWRSATSGSSLAPAAVVRIRGK